MVDPLNPSLASEDWSDDSKLQWWILFCVSAAGKTAYTTRVALNRFFEPWQGLIDRGIATPYGVIDILNLQGALDTHLRASRLGQYNRLTRAFTELQERGTNFLRVATVDELQAIHGVGPKTARFFLISTRPNQRYAVLDTHILKFLKANHIPAPKSTPQSMRRYKELEFEFLWIADRLGKDPAVLDMEVWLEYARKESL